MISVILDNNLQHQYSKYNISFNLRERRNKTIAYLNLVEAPPSCAQQGSFRGKSAATRYEGCVLRYLKWGNSWTAVRSVNFGLLYCEDRSRGRRESVIHYCRSVSVSREFKPWPRMRAVGEISIYAGVDKIKFESSKLSKSLAGESTRPIRLTNDIASRESMVCTGSIFKAFLGMMWKFAETKRLFYKTLPQVCFGLYRYMYGETRVAPINFMAPKHCTPASTNNSV